VGGHCRGEGTGQATQPDHVEVEFGVKISASRNVIVAGLAAESKLTVKLVCDATPATSA